MLGAYLSDPTTSLAHRKVLFAILGEVATECAGREIEFEVRLVDENGQQSGLPEDLTAVANLLEDVRGDPA